jgi:hypothetical protein
MSEEATEGQTAEQQTTAAEPEPTTAPTDPMDKRYPWLGERLKRAEQAGTKALLEQLGVTDPDELKAMLDFARQTREAQQTEAQKAAAEAEKHGKQAAKLAEELAAEKAAHLAYRRQTEFGAAARALKVPEDRIAAALRLADWSDDAEPATVAEAVVKANPFLVAQAEPAPVTTDGAAGRSSSGAASANGTPDSPLLRMMGYGPKTP